MIPGPAHAPSLRQLATFDGRGPGEPVVLFHEYSVPDERVAPALAALAHEHGGELRWAARGAEALIGPAPPGESMALLHFRTRAGARAFVLDARHARILAPARALRVSVVSAPPPRLALVVALASVLARWLPLDDTPEPGDEPGIGTSVMPTAAALADLRGHPCQDEPVVMVNWLKFRDRAAYRRYGRTALLAIHRLGGRLLFAARCRQVLIGDGGEPGPERWDEFLLVQYPGRAVFQRMTALRRYRRALPHRTAGLAEHGQGLVIAHPQPQFTWRAGAGGRSRNGESHP